MAQGLLLQVAAPLQFLGWFYRELRQSLVDMEAFFKILTTQPKLPDGHLTLPQPSISGSVNGSQRTAKASSQEHAVPQNGQRYANGGAWDWHMAMPLRLKILGSGASDTFGGHCTQTACKASASAHLGLQL